MTSVFIRVNELRVHRLESRLMALNKAISSKLDLIAKIKLAVANSETVQQAMAKSMVSASTAEDLAAIDRIIDKRGRESKDLLQKLAQHSVEIEDLYGQKRDKLKELSAAQAKLEQCILLQKAVELKRRNVVTEASEQDILDVRSQGRQRADAATLNRG